MQPAAMSAHRAAYLLTGHKVPAGYDVDHICVNPPCCNPDHLQALTPSDNSRLVQMRKESFRGVSVYRRRNKAGWSWQVKWRDRGMQHSATFTREVAARQHARVLHADRMAWA